MIRWIVYSFAAAVDTVLSAASFVCTVRLAGMGASATGVAGVLSLWAGVYMVASLAAGRLVTQRNAGWLLTGACLSIAGLSGAFILLPGRGEMYVLMAVQAVAIAFFFTPFQCFMKLVDQGQNKSVTRSSGLYVFSWSTGFAVGPFVAGYLWALFGQAEGWKACHVFNIGVALLVTFGVWRLKHHASADCVTAREDAAGAAHDEYAAMPDWAWMAWVFSGAGCLIASLIRAVFPSSGEYYHIPKPDQGMVLCLLSAVQALVGIGLGFTRKWMYRPLPVLGFGAFGLAGLLLFARADSAADFYVAAMCFGVYSGAFYFYFIFHSLVHPTRAPRYVSINEAVVGFVGIIGPALGGYLGDARGLAWSYGACVAILAVTLAVQAGVHAVLGRRTAPVPVAVLAE
jgi:MFS family permease